MNCRMALLSALTATLLIAVVLFGSASIAAQTSAGSSTVSQQTTAATTLELAKPIERELAGGQSHSYQIPLAAGQYLHVVVDQRGIDVVVALFEPDGKKLTEVDSPNGTQGPEPVYFIVEASGLYRLEVRSDDKTAVAGKYEAKIEEVRAATEQDRSRVVAERALAEAELLSAQGTAESLRKAISKYEGSLPHLRSAREQLDEVRTLDKIGFIYDALGEKKKALDYYNRALALEQILGDRRAEANTLNNIGNVYDDLGDTRNALDYYNRALQLRRAVGDRGGQAATLSNIGIVYAQLGEKQKALDYYNQALPLRRAVGDRKGEARSLNNIGSLYDDLGEKQKALDSYKQALSLVRALGDRRVVAAALHNIGLFYSRLGEMRKAIDYFNEALLLERAAGDRNAEASTLNVLGNVNDSLGDGQKALDYYNQALPLERAVGDRRGEVGTLNNIANVYDELGEKQKALDYYNQALSLIRALGLPGLEAGTLHNIGIVYGSLGEKQKALDHLKQALSLRRANGDRFGEALTLVAMGSSDNSLDNIQGALDYYSQALALMRALGDRPHEGYALNEIGTVYYKVGEKQKALEYYKQSLSVSRAVADRRREAATLNNIGALYDLLGDKQKSLGYYNQALPLARVVGDRNSQAETLYGIARVEIDLGQLNEARTNLEAALNIIEQLRTKVTSAELRASYLSTVQHIYQSHIELLMRLHKQRPSEGFNSAALQASERGRSRSLLELLTEAHADIRQGVDPKLLERERSLQQLLNGKAERQIRLLGGNHTDDQAAEAAKEIEALKTEYQQVEAEIKAKSPHYAALTQPQPLRAEQIQQLLDRDTLLLEYSLGDDRSYLWAVTQSSIASYEVPKRTEIETAAKQFYEALTAPNQQSRNVRGSHQLSRIEANAQDQHVIEASARLSQMLLAPVAARLEKKRLVIVADGALQYVPFAALSAPAAQRAGAGRQRSDGNLRAVAVLTPLIIDHEIVSLPSASTLAVLRRETEGRKPAEKVVAVLADPVFDKDDERVSSDRTEKRANAESAKPSVTRQLEYDRTKKAASQTGVAETGLSIPRLPGTRQEAERILAFAPASARMQALDFEASKATTASPELSQYRYVHFATHGFLNSANPELSGIVLSMVDHEGQPQNGFLLTNEVFNLRLSAELVVLSACQTGLGKEIKGEGLVGLTRGFMYAGAPRVIVSLWSVDDKATSEMMARLYKGLLQEHLRPAVALRMAQIEMWKQKRWQAPYSWAAFVLQGEWR